ncbi:MAG TPA: replication terminator protein, partial [Lachnospiraceae bacterium]|nr:replication terminator protein [Lachnospiraceae bacterium]
MKQVNLEKFAGGALSQQVSRAINQVMRNMQDVNTPSKDKRKVTVDLTFEQDEQREDVQVIINVKTKLS